MTMKLSDQSLRQRNPEYLSGMNQRALLVVSIVILHDLIELWERLHQNSDNSSRPPSTDSPWERPRSDESGNEADFLTAQSVKLGEKNGAADREKKQKQQSVEPLTSASSTGTTGKRKL